MYARPAGPQPSTSHSWSGSCVLDASATHARCWALSPIASSLVHRLLLDARVPRRSKFLLGALIGYLAMPFDLVPDFIPVAGQLDDALIVVLVLRSILRAGGPDLLRRAWFADRIPPHRPRSHVTQTWSYASHAAHLMTRACTSCSCGRRRTRPAEPLARRRVGRHRTRSACPRDARPACPARQRGRHGRVRS